jgi:hypothetical protein
MTHQSPPGQVSTPAKRAGKTEQARGTGQGNEGSPGPVTRTHYHCGLAGPRSQPGNRSPKISLVTCCVHPSHWEGSSVCCGRGLVSPGALPCSGAQLPIPSPCRGGAGGKKH